MTPRLATDLKDRTWLVAESKHGRIIYIRIDEIQSIYFTADGPCASIETPGCFFDLANTPDQIWALLEKPEGAEGSA